VQAGLCVAPKEEQILKPRPCGWPFPLPQAARDLLGTDRLMKC
jgi:hypothetical protein